VEERRKQKWKMKKMVDISFPIPLSTTQKQGFTDSLPPHKQQRLAPKLTER